jgi:YD repeat-containing protein
MISSEISSEISPEISPDLLMLLEMSRSPTSQARYRAQNAPPHPGTFFQDVSTLGIGRWAERPQRDGLGRITAMTDASGNRSTFRYGARGFEGMHLEPRGPLDPRWGQTGLLLRKNPARGFFSKRPIFNDPQDESRIEGGRWVSPLSNATQSVHSPMGGRFFTRYDVLGRPMYSFDASGKLSFNRYGPHGNLIGTYNARGKLTLFGHDTRGRRNFAVDSSGSRILLDQDRKGGAVIRTPDGKVIKTGGDFGDLKPQAISAGIKSERKDVKEAGKPEK